MTEKELKRLLAEKSAAPERKNIALVLSPHIVRTAAHLKKRQRDRVQTALCILAAVIFLSACALLFILSRNAADPAAVWKYAAMIVGGSMVLFLICAPVLVWHEENS